MEKVKVLCVVGATASGKTSLGVALAQRLGGEIISADSMQVYRDMPIATAAATVEEQAGIPHHLLAFLAPEERFSVAEFVRLAKETALAIHRRGKLPIIVGGTGLFIDSLIQNISFSDVEAADDLREALAGLDNETLYAMLQRADPAAAAEIHPHNRKRVIRALELYEGGVTKTQQNKASHREESPFEALYLGIGYRERENLYERINRRVDLMLEAGLLKEAEEALAHAGPTARQAIGHKELAPYLNGEAPLEACVENMKKETRRYAKRQLTWFRKNQEIIWLYADEMSEEALIDAAETAARQFLTRGRTVREEDKNQ